MSTYDQHGDIGIDVDEVAPLDEVMSVSEMLNVSPSVHVDFFNSFGDLCDIENVPAVPNS